MFSSTIIKEVKEKKKNTMLAKLKEMKQKEKPILRKN